MAEQRGETMKPTAGRIVHYALTQYDADAINQRRSDFHAHTRAHRRPETPGEIGATGHQGDVGNPRRRPWPLGVACARLRPEDQGRTHRTPL
jgi:hypothetical protein